MSIEVITSKDNENKEKGELLENLTAEFLKTQGFTVAHQVRITASELDLLCIHSMDRSEVYVECKAHRDTLSSNVLKNLLGTVTFNDYHQGWLVSTGPLGKDALGFVAQWDKNPADKRNKLRIYTPEKILDAFLSARLIVDHPEQNAKHLLESLNYTVGEWCLLVSPWGMFWAVSALKAGIPNGVLFYSADRGDPVVDLDVLERIKSSDFLLSDLDFITEERANRVTREPDYAVTTTPIVVEVTYGDRWNDYRPAHPDHFVGRREAQRNLLQFFSSIKRQRTDTRIFALKGDSGIGKSSLVAKMRHTANSSRRPNNLFLFAVDVRAASDSSYIHSALLYALRAASQAGFGTADELEITNRADPIQSNSISTFLAECSRKRQLVILVFDQFEELYSRADLYPVFEEVKRLMFSTISASSSLVLGFSWKTDSTVPQSHPAYHLWHELTDHRFEVQLRRFSHSDAEQSLGLFEREMGQKIIPALRRYILENSQGYPWLLKKLCIHLYEQLQSGISQHQMTDRAFDISSLFDQDLNNLTAEQLGCLRLVARNAPMDWCDVLETAGHDVVQSLQKKRLIIRSGDKLNLYWDIFRDYVLTKSIPSIPFTYIPQAPSLNALIRVAMLLDVGTEKTISELASACGLESSTVHNIIHDLFEFGVASGSYDSVRMESGIEVNSETSVLRRLRVVFRRHRLVDLLERKNSVSPASITDVVSYLKSINPTAQYHTRTWGTYANKLLKWLIDLGYVKNQGKGVVFRDEGDVSPSLSGGPFRRIRVRANRRGQVFIAEAPPASVIAAMEHLLVKGKCTQNEMKARGYRNACYILHRFGLIIIDETANYVVSDRAVTSNLLVAAIWNSAHREESITFGVDYFRKNPAAEPQEFAAALGREHGKQWSPSSLKTVGKNLRLWLSWLMTPVSPDGSVPPPPSLKHRLGDDPSQTMLL